MLRIMFVSRGSNTVSTLHLLFEFFVNNDAVVLARRRSWARRHDHVGWHGGAGGRVGATLLAQTLLLA